MENMLLDEIPLKTKSFFTCIDSFSAILKKTIITTQRCEVLLLEHGFELFLKILMSCKQKHGVVYIIGNGGSAAIASHASIDFINMVKMKATAMLDSAVTTCISNDYGYAQIYAKQLEVFIQPQDVLIAISSSGNSMNMIHAVDVAMKKNANVITFSGFLANNSLRQLGQYNLWLDSKDYGQVEIGHAFVLHYLTDSLRGIK